MNIRTLALVSGAAAGALTLAGCGGSDNGMGTSSVAPTTPPATQQLDTAGVLSIVQTKTSETASPFVVDGGAVALVPSDDETGEPIAVNGA